MKRFTLGLIAVLILVAGVTVVSQQPPKNPHGQLKWDCQVCHTPQSWSTMREPMTFDHNETGFALIGRHRTAACSGCHKDLHFAKVEQTCVKCHNDVHRGQMGASCQDCHTSENWQNRQDVFNLHSQNGFLLSGVHAITDCEACHKNEPGKEFSAVSTECEACHASTYAATQNPNHAQAGFPLHCASCHEAELMAWRTVKFDHSATFPLIGGHSRAVCSDCHKGQLTAAPVRIASVAMKPVSPAPTIQIT